MLDDWSRFISAAEEPHGKGRRRSPSALRVRVRPARLHRVRGDGADAADDRNPRRNANRAGHPAAEADPGNLTDRYDMAHDDPLVAQALASFLLQIAS
jgi:hypothetical protein